MCGITGFVDFSAKANPKLVRLMSDQIVYRGPDSSGQFTEGPAALAIRRLSIIDLDGGNQPISNEDNTVTVVFNGEIYNFLELKDSLIKKGHQFKTHSDTEVLVHLFEEYQEKMVDYLNGMFAFAIWDKKRQQLFLARDPAGIKPLYYFRSGDKLIFGSEPKTILRYPNFKTTIDNNALKHYAYFGYIPGTLSIYSGVEKLLPGHTLSFSKKGFFINRFFTPLKKDLPEESLENLIENSVRAESIADVPLGVFLSGGLDSSLVTYCLTKVVSQVKTFSISFKEKSFDEGNYASQVAKLLGTEHYNDFFNSQDIKNNFDKVCSQLDEPLADSSIFPTFKVSQLARKYVKVVLSGDGGDELFGGYPTYQGHLIAEKLQFMPKLVWDLCLQATKVLPSSYKNYATRDVLTAFFNGLSQKTLPRHLLWMSVFSQGQNFVDLLNDKNPKLPSEGLWLKEILESQDSMVNASTLARLVDYFTYLPDDLLVKVDRASMFNSLEVRVPFLDPKIIKYAFSTSEKHLDFFSTKRLFRKILKGKLPKSIIGRKKKGFGIPVAKWLREDLLELADDNLKNKKLDDYFDRKTISRLWQDHLSQRRNNAKVLWMIIMLSGWLKYWSKN